MIIAIEREGHRKRLFLFFCSTSLLWFCAIEINQENVLFPVIVTYAEISK